MNYLYILKLTHSQTTPLTRPPTPYPSATNDVSLAVVNVFNDEDHVESREDRGHEVNVLFALGVVPSTKHRIRRRQHRTSSVQRRRDSGLERSALLQFIDLADEHFQLPSASES